MLFSGNLKSKKKIAIRKSNENEIYYSEFKHLNE